MQNQKFLVDLLEAPLPVPVYAPGLVAIVRRYQGEGLVEAELPDLPGGPTTVTAITSKGYRVLRSLRRSPTWSV